MQMDPSSLLLVRISLAWQPGRVVASRVEAVRPLEFIYQQNRVDGNSSRLPCSDSDDSDDDILLVGAVRPLTSAAPLGGTEMLDDCRLQADSLDDVL